MANLNGTIKDVVSQLVAVLNPKNRDVVWRRFGLKTGRKETLESIGQSYDITRERVRQIEEASLKQIRQNLTSNLGAKVKPFVGLAESILDQNGGVLREDEFFRKFFGSDGMAGKTTSSNNDAGKNGDGSASAALVFVLTLDGTLKRYSEDDDFNSFWSLSQTHTDGFKHTIGLFIEALDQNRVSVPEHQAAELYKKADVPLKYLNPTVITAFTSITKKIDRNVFSNIGLTSWPEIKPRGVRDKSYLVLKREGKPKHFREIAQLINTINFSNRKANVQTVHNELIKDKRFVLVGRGMYALAEWGYKTGTVKDVLVDLLRSAKRPLRRDDIVAQVLSHRMVKENTILLNLQDSKVFKKSQDGTYTLSEA